MSAPANPRTFVVVPCYNEEKRIDPRVFWPFVKAEGDTHVLFVNDGSRDGTHTVLTRLVAELGPRASMLDLPKNGGKAEAVRHGLKEAIARGATIVGYYDADGATDAGEAIGLARELSNPAVSVVLASRVSLLGREIQRKVTRHYTGRVFATVASLVLQLPVYDTQCGAKFFRVSPLLIEVLESPFTTRWAFDVEFLSRLVRGTPRTPGLTAAAFLEVPLKRWVDVDGSTLKPTAYPKVFGELLGIAARSALRGRGAR